MYPASYWKKSVGQWFGSKYLLKAFLGCGAYGAVFQADEMIAERIIQTVAIKIVIVDLERLDQQIEELQLAVRLRHPHLINGITCEQGDINGDLCIGLVMELADDSLENYLKVNKPPLAVEFVSTLVEHLAEGLAYIHDQGIIHRDLKPANILRVGENWKLADLGIARSLQDGTSTYTNPSQQIGTIAYMPPESYGGRISSAWDLWSLGVMIHDLLSNQHPFPSNIVPELIQMVLNEEPTLSQNLDLPFREIVKGCLVKEPKDRWTAQQVLTALQLQVIQFASSSASQSPPLPIPPVSSRPQVLTLDLPNNIKLEMIKIPAGSFLMGATENDVDASDSEKPQHLVTLQEYYLGKYSVTQEQYEAIMGSNPSQFKNNPKNPVERVRWNDAKAFCETVYKTTGQKVRLPTEAEWEYACQAMGPLDPFFKDENLPRYHYADIEKELENYAWHRGNSGDKTHPVGQKKPNNWGLYDMQGNVWEWCEDNWHHNYRDKPDNLKQDGSKAWLSNNNFSHVVRGGSWCRNPRKCRLTTRHWDNLLFWNDYFIGFRLALSIS